MSDFDELERDYFGSTVGKDLFHMMCGDRIGGGVGRLVYEYVPDKTCVIKVENNAQSFQNVIEWDLWKQHAYAGTTVCDWMAPCVLLSANGIFLVQKRTKPVPCDFKLPKRVPNVLCGDMKRDNWGLLKGKLVCHDYGRHEAVYYASKATRYGNMVRAEWAGASGDHFAKVFGATDVTGLI